MSAMCLIVVLGGPHFEYKTHRWDDSIIGQVRIWGKEGGNVINRQSYQHTKYHKQTKNQWARDDPAFVVICSLLLVVATSAYCAAYDHSSAHAVFVVISVLLFHFLITGIFLATCCWFLTNAYLREEAPNSHVVEQRVEWLYAFDVHCNSFFPMFVLLYVIHYFLSPLLVAHGFIPVLLSNLLFMVATSYYHYLNFLGYDVLPFLERTTFFLYPIGCVIILSPIFILSGFNPSRYIMNMYFSQFQWSTEANTQYIGYIMRWDLRGN